LFERRDKEHNYLVKEGLHLLNERDSTGGTLVSEWTKNISEKKLSFPTRQKTKAQRKGKKMSMGGGGGELELYWHMWCGERFLQTHRRTKVQGGTGGFHFHLAGENTKRKY